MQASGPESSCSSRDAIEAEAARLLAKLNSDPSPQDEADLCAWVEADPRNAIAFARAEAAWEAAERLKSAAAEVTLPPIAEIVSEEQQRRRSRNIMMAAGVAILLFVVAAIVTVRTFNDVERYQTRIGEIRNLRLTDGSVVHLNSDSEAEVRFTNHGRKVRILKGEASFNVAPDRERPFEVEARSALIRARGTAFNVRLRPSLIEVTVIEGAVSLSCGNHRAERVTAGGGAVLQPRSFVLTRLDPQLISQRTAWRRQMVELNGETVEQATSEFNRYRPAPILIGDTRVSSLRVSGQFRTSDSRAFLAMLQRALPIRTVNGEDGSVMLLYRDALPDAP